MSQLGEIEDKIELPTVVVNEITSRLQATAGRVQLLNEATTQDDD